MATFKHISSKNADYGAAEAYLTFEHDEFTMKPTLDENGRLIPREDYRISSLNCGGEDFAVACMRANLRYEKNQKREDVKSHHYIISFDPRDGTDNGLTVDRAQELGEQFCKEHFPGHQALVCTHPDGHNHSGNIHVHIVINSLRIYEVTLLPYMDRPADTRAGCKHRCTNAAMEYFKSEVMEMCHREGLYQIDLLNGSKERITEREYWAAKKGQLALDKENAAREAAGQPTKPTKFETDKAKLRRTIRQALSQATSFDEFSSLLLREGVTVKESRGRLSYLTPDRTKPITARKLGDDFDKAAVLALLTQNARRAAEQTKAIPEYTEATGIATVKVDKAQQYGKVSMKFYIYGETPSTPSLTDRTGDAKAQVTYYYNTTNSNSGGTEWKNIQPDTLSAGTRYYMYAELGETENYESFTTDCVKFWVMKAIPTCTKPTGLTAKYGQKLSQIALPNPEGNTPGTWRWQEPETVLDQLGTRSFYADFKPDNETYSEVLNVAIDVTVGPADGGSLKTVELAQKYTDASVHTYKPDWSGLPGGQTWRYNSEYSVSTGSNVTLTKQDFTADGSLLTYAVSGGKAGDKITLTLKASCDNYGDFTITLNITLTEKDDQKPLTITGNTSVIYGEKLTLTTSGGNGTGAVTYRIDTAHSTGEAAIDPNTGVLTPVRIGSVSVIAAKAGDNDYNDVTSAPFVLMIKPATPTGEPNYTKITTGGKTLKDAALTTKGSTLHPNDGKLEWLDDKGNALPDDTRVKANTTYKWRFTPTDTNYTTLTGEVELLYHKSNGGGSSGYSYYTIEATAGAGGSISPSGSVSVREGGDQTFTITPDKGYAVSNVKIDGKSIGAVKSYTFENVSRTHTIEVIFVKGTASARTGDGSDLPLWSALLLASTLTLAGAVHYKRKRAR